MLGIFVFVERIVIWQFEDVSWNSKRAIFDNTSCDSNGNCPTFEYKIDFLVSCKENKLESGALMTIENVGNVDTKNAFVAQITFYTQIFDLRLN